MPRGPEIPTDKFIELLKKRKAIIASPSHEQDFPNHISQYAILNWQYDGEIFSITRDGRRVVCSKNMPAFHEHIKGE